MATYKPKQTKLVPDPIAKPIRTKKGPDGKYYIEENQCGIKEANDFFKTKYRHPKVFKF